MRISSGLWLLGCVAMAGFHGDRPVLSLSVQDPESQEQGMASGNARLKPLEWMLGEWEARDEGGGTQHVLGRWSDDGNYLLLDHWSEEPGMKNRISTERIAWDPEQQTIRSWLFRPDGSFGESKWRQDGDHWRSEIRNVLPDGQLATASGQWIRLSPDRLRVRMTNLRIGGVEAPDMELEFARKGEVPGHSDQGSGGSPMAAEIVGKTWELIDVDGVPMEFERKPSFRIDQGRVQAFGGVNRMGGTCEVGDGTLRFGPLASTRMAGPPDLMQMEMTFAEVLAKTDSYELDQQELVLKKGSKPLARFRMGR